MKDINVASRAIASQLKDVQYPFAFKSIDWDEYRFHRPGYPPTMWDIWTGYHASHCVKFEAAHDLGSGPGTAARDLSHHFNHVYVSDAGKNNIAAVRQQLKPAEKFSFSHFPAEVPWLGDSTIDLASICMALHFMDSDAVFRNVAKTIRPGGTLAACTTCSFKPKFPNCRRLEKLWFDAVSATTERIMAEGKLFPAAMESLRKVMVGLDGTRVPADLFGNVVRLQLNIQEGEPPAVSGGINTSRPPSSRSPSALLESIDAVWPNLAAMVASYDLYDDEAWERYEAPSEQVAAMKGFVDRKMKEKKECKLIDWYAEDSESKLPPDILAVGLAERNELRTDLACEL